MKNFNSISRGTHSNRRGFTLIEVLMALVLGAMATFMIVSLSIMVGKMHKSIFSQQQSVANAKTAIESINREIRLATTPMRVLNSAGNAVNQGNKVQFSRMDGITRRFELRSVDGDMMTPWDNTLVYIPNTAAGGNGTVIARGVTPVNAAGAFTYTSATTPLRVQMRVGDPVGVTEAATKASDAHTGQGMQGFEINITVAPRN